MYITRISQNLRPPTRLNQHITRHLKRNSAWLLLIGTICSSCIAPTPEGGREVTSIRYEEQQDDELLRLKQTVRRLEAQLEIEKLKTETAQLQLEKVKLEQSVQQQAAEEQAKAAAEAANRASQLAAEQQEKDAQRKAMEEKLAAVEADHSPTKPSTQGVLKGTLQVASKSGTANVSNVMINLERDGAQVTTTPQTHTIDMANKAFSAKFKIIRPGDRIVFRNLDPFKHNVFSLSNGNKFDLGLYEAGTAPGYTFETEGVVKVYCNVHPEMACFIMVTNSPWIYTTDKSGNFSFDDLEAGTYTVNAWSVRGAYKKEIDVIPGKTARLDFTIDGSQYTGPKHPNKFGKSYPNRARNERY